MTDEQVIPLGRDVALEALPGLPSIAAGRKAFRCPILHMPYAACDNSNHERYSINMVDPHACMQGI